MATNGTLNMTATAAPKTKCAINSLLLVVKLQDLSDGCLERGSVFRSVGRRYLFGRGRQSRSGRFLQRHSRTRSRGPFLVVVPVGRCTPRRQNWRTSIAKDDRQTVFTAADEDHLRIRGLRKLKRRLDAAPTKVGLRDALADDLLVVFRARRETCIPPQCSIAQFCD